MTDQQLTNQTSRRNTWIAAGVVCLGAAALFVMWSSSERHADSPQQADTPPQTNQASRISDQHKDGASAANTGIASSNGANSPNSALTEQGTSARTANPEGPAVTRATRRDSVVMPSGVRKLLVDPMASWQDLPPWPEGPRIFVEVETSTRKYVNLRPDDIGELPRVYASAEERIELRIHFPEGTPGEKIFIEIPNGGSFPDLESFGRVYQLPENRTLSFSYITDHANGYCTVALRHRGHTRSLPIWIGEPPEPAPSDS